MGALGEMGWSSTQLPSKDLVPGRLVVLASFGALQAYRSWSELVLERMGDTRMLARHWMIPLMMLVSHPAAATSAKHVAGPSINVAAVNGIKLAYRIYGPGSGRTMLLLAGTDMQLIEWPPSLIDGLVKQGFRVIVFDPRDAGGSTSYAASGAPDWRAVFEATAAGRTPPLPYQASDMVGDAVALVSKLGLKTVDLLGLSGGATVAELMAVSHPEMVRSLTLIAANAGDPSIPLPADPARLAAVPQPKPGDGRAAVAARRLAAHRALAGKADGFDEATVRQLVDRTVERNADPFAFARQGAALIVLGDLRPKLAKIDAPTVVLHGEDDPLVSIRSGAEVARTIPGARFIPLPGVGHGVPSGSVEPILAAVKWVTQRR